MSQFGVFTLLSSIAFALLPAAQTSAAVIDRDNQTVAVPPDNQTALYCVWNTEAGQQVCYRNYCDAHPRECTTSFLPTDQILVPITFAGLHRDEDSIH